jgi:ABC-type transport system substrate-binding protein
VEGESVEMIRNDHYANEGFTHQFWSDGSYALNGEMLYGEGTGDPAVEYTEGPYLDRMVFSLYDDQAAAMLALVDGDIDYWLAPPLSPAIRRQGQEADNLAVTVNPPNGYQYLTFNLRKSPGKFAGFRQAMAYFDKENLVNNVLQGAFTPLYVLVPEGNEAWYDKETAGEIASRYVGLGADERLVTAYAALEADGFTWQVPAVFEDGVMVSTGEGIIDPDGNTVPPLAILTPPAALLPERHTAALWLEDWAESLGIPAEATTTEGFDIFGFVWPGVGIEPTFDMAILFWSLSDAAWPTYHEAFFHTRNLAETTDGRNNSGYSNPDFDALADAMFTETDQAAAFDRVWQMERMLADDLPYMLLYTAPITEFYSTDLEFPFTQTLAGIQNLNGMPGMVDK